MIKQRSYQQASQAIKDNLKRHLERNDQISVSDSDEESSEDDSEKITKLIDSYTAAGPGAGKLESKFVQSLVNNLKDVLSTSSCLICISTVKKTDSIWSCHNCYNSFHVDCIQKWAKDSIFQQKNQLEDDPDRLTKEKEIKWTCPKCRNGYQQSSIPRDYYCYCKKVRDPKFDPWNAPHSCGDLCGRSLSGAGCDHKCLLLCHPGPCPPCPQTVSISCHCSKARPTVRRCYAKLWSCGDTCNRKLNCNVHVCPETCHDGACPPCTKTSVQSCDCGKVKEPRACSSPDYKCAEKCGKRLSCSHHSCDIVCHSGPCPPCPLSLERFCPCGKSGYKLSCTEATPTCGDTCNKLLSCGAHHCTERCHRGACPSCLQLRKKSCRCGAKTRDIQCAREFTCETKCKKLRDCKRHSCNKKCCTGDCPPCEQPCNKTLNCKNHKCSSRCHTGVCYPCQLVQKVSCNCGKTSHSVACGREKSARPPRCREKCDAASICHHKDANDHNCHFGACPPCRETCGLTGDCGHKCTAQCHDNVKVKVEQSGRPAGPWEDKGPQYIVTSQPCPPCSALVSVTCLGGHDTGQWPCHSSKPASCGRQCGRQLACGNHQCARECHKVRGAADDVTAGANCKKCELECSKPRPQGCNHPCSIGRCHPDSCPDCEHSVKMKCHCGLAIKFVKCAEYLTANDETRDSLLCCGDQCPKLMSCGHRCLLQCHRGQCSDIKECKKKVKVYCKCKRRKEEFRCNQSFNIKTNVDCDDDCRKSKKSLEEKGNCDQGETEEEIRKRKEAELFERQMAGGKRKRRPRAESCHEKKTSLVNNKTVIFASIAFAAVAFMTYLAFT